MESYKDIESNGKYYIKQVMILEGHPYEVGKYSTIDPFWGQRTKKACISIKLYKNLANAKKLYNKLTNK